MKDAGLPRWPLTQDGMESRARMNPKDKKVDTVTEFRAKIHALEQERDSRIFCLIHHGQNHICHPTMRAVYANRAETGYGARLEILMHSPGGHPDFAFQVMKFFRRRYKEVNIIVPLMAKSAATLMCLGADRVFMGEFGDLGPIDIQIDDPVDKGDRAISPLDEFKSLEYMRDMAIEWLAYFSALAREDFGMSVKQALEHGVPFITGLMQPILGQIDPLEVGSYRRSLAIAEEYGKRMLDLTGQQNDRLVHELVWEYPAHSFCIDYEEADRLGLPVEKLSDEQDHRFCEAVLGLEKGYYHGFASSQHASKRPTTETPAVLPKGAVNDGPSGRNNGGRNRVGKGNGAPPPTDAVENEKSKAPTTH
jgi:hypothetical protein